MYANSGSTHDEVLPSPPGEGTSHRLTGDIRYKYIEELG